jgi:hypothetical protein
MYGANNTMRNGGSPPTHLPSSSPSDYDNWLQLKWSQPPPRAPNWLFASYQAYNPPPGVGFPGPWEDWHQRAFRKDQQAAGLLPPGLNAPIRPGSGPSTTCGQTSATAKNSSSRCKPLELARWLLLLAPAKRLPAANSSLTRKPLAFARRLLWLAHARRLLAANSSSMRKRSLDRDTPPASLPSALPRTTRLVYFLPNASLPSASTRTDVRPNAASRNKNGRPTEPSSCGFAAATSTSGSPARLRGACNMRPTSHACGTRTNAVRVLHSPRTNVDRGSPQGTNVYRQPPCVTRPLSTKRRTRLMSRYAETRLPSRLSWTAFRPRCCLLSHHFWISTSPPTWRGCIL